MSPQAWTAKRSWRRSPVASNFPFHIAQPHFLPRFCGSGNGHHRSHSSDPVVDACSSRGTSMQDRIGKTFDLKLVGVSVCSERPTVLSILCGEALYLARFVKPRKKKFALDAAMLSINSESL